MHLELDLKPPRYTSRTRRPGPDSPRRPGPGLTALPCLWLSAALAFAAEPAPRPLSAFGAVATAEQAQATLTAAVAKVLGEGGGVIVIPPDAPDGLTVENLSQTERKSGDDHPVVTIVDNRKGYLAYEVAPIGKLRGTTWSGFAVQRKLNLGQNSLPHCGTHPAQSIDNFLVSGASSYMTTLTEAVTKGTDVRCYVDTIRGVWVGANFNITSSPMGYASPYDRVRVKSLGWDKDRRRSYFTCDLEFDHPAGALVYNKHVTNGLYVDTWSNCDNQTPGDIAAVRHHYAVGDAFVISGMMSYMGDIFSGFGDEGGVVLNAETVGEIDGFHARVEAIDWSRDEVTYAPGQVMAQTLSNSRPLINMNRAKWLTQGTVLVVAPGDTYKGQSYAGRIGGPGNTFNYQGGAIIGSADAPWDESIIGRFFALTDDSEVILPNDPSPVGGYASAADRPVYRWYEVKELEGLPDGRKRLKILRVRWSAVAAGAPTLFDAGNYSRDGAEKPLHYAIAPGAWVYDISQGWVHAAVTGGVVEKTAPRKLRVTPTGDRGTGFDFAVGDPVEQPCGPDPWQPRPVRIRQFDQIPSTMESATIEADQLGRVQVPSFIAVSSLAANREEFAQRKDKRAPFGTILCVNSASTVGIDFRGDTVDTAIMFRQPNDHPQPIRWRNNTVGSSSLAVEPGTGDFRFQGGNLDAGGHSLQGATGLSATDRPAANLRGINLAVPPGGTVLRVTFERPEADAAYALILTPSWLTQTAVSAKTPAGFTVQFGNAAPAGATLDWIMVR